MACQINLARVALTKTTMVLAQTNFKPLIGISMKRSIYLAIAIFSLSGCGGTDPMSDVDGDGISYEDEIAQGTNPDLMDSDGDGLDDAEEMLCGSDPMNVEDVCYKCGWKKNDPGRLASTGNDIGDLIENVQMVDQCGDTVSIWDFYGEYHILYMTAAW